MSVDRPTFHIPAVEAGMNKEQKFQHAIAGGITASLLFIEQQFENTPIRADRLTYHIRPHTEGTIARTKTILQTIQQANPESSLVTAHEIALGTFAAAWHDTVQAWEPTISTDAQGNEMRKRKRAIGDNESASADLAEIYMQATNEKMGEEIFSTTDMAIVREAIMLTVPFFDPDAKTVIQPGFANKHIVSQAVALADLGGGGMEGYATARWEADAIFVEDNLDFAAYKHIYQEPDAKRRIASLRQPESELVFYNRMIAWLTSQVNFSEGRQAHLQKEIAVMDERAKVPVQQLFARFTETIAGMQTLVAQRKAMDFSTCMTDIQTTLQNRPVYTIS